MSHAPKVAALLAYDADLLSAEGVRRIEAHLEVCDVCRETVASMRVYDAVVNEARRASAPTIDYSRMELALRREARATASALRSPDAGGGNAWLAAALLAAAAVLLVVLPGEPAPPPPDSERSSDRAPTALPPPVLGEITATVGLTTYEPAVDRELRVGDPVRAGMGLATDAASEAHVRLADGTGVQLLEHTRLRVDELRDGRVRLELVDGAVSNEVADLGDGDRYEVRAGPWVVSVHGTRFSVRHQRGALAVEVTEGVVEVRFHERLVRRLSAPATWSSDPGLSPAGVAEPIGLGPGSDDWPVVEIAENDAVSEWQVGDRRLPAGRIAMRAPVGDLDVVGWADGRVALRRVVAVLRDGARLAPEPVAPDAPAVRIGTLEPELIAPVVQRGQHRLRQCKNLADRGETEVFGRFTLQITIDRTGAVRRANLVTLSGQTSESFVACVLGQARGWAFPPPTGGIVNVDVPLRFQTAPLR
jgi:hypothetical protein